MALWILLIVAVFSVLGMVLMLFLTQSKLRSSKHSIDPKPKKTFQGDEDL
ncbi:hypothetical protein [Paenisporosarcina antarctica]|nr:hypothetical protein [Paenisporosarcina antarctica]